MLYLYTYYYFTDTTYYTYYFVSRTEALHAQSTTTTATITSVVTSSTKGILSYFPTYYELPSAKGILAYLLRTTYELLATYYYYVIRNT